MTPPRTQESREDQAKREAGQTDFSHGVRPFLFLVFLLIVCGVPLIDQTLDWLHRRASGESLPRPQVFDLVDAVPSRGEAVETLKRDGAFRAGYLMNAKLLKGMVAYEDALEDESRVAQWLLPPMQSLLIGWLGAGNEQAYCGRSGWLFYRPEIDYLIGPGFLESKVLAARARRGDEWNPPPQPDPVKAILEFQDALAARGITLVLLPAPGKAMVYPEKFSSRYDGARALENPSFAAFKEAVEASGVLVCETAPALLELKRRGTQSFLACDTHWSPQGAEQAARVLAALLREKDLLPRRAPIAYTRSEATVENLGDVANMLNLPEGQTIYPPEHVTLRQVRAPDGEWWQPSEDADILFLGDSYANIYSLAGMGWGQSAGVIEHLSAELGRPIDTILMNDNGAYATRRQLSRELARGNDRLAGKKVVVYEFAARELAVGDWKTGLPLEVGKSNRGAAAAVQPAGTRATATIAAMTLPPKPGTVPYKDCIVSLHLTGVSRQVGATLPSAAVVFVWGMRDNVWTPATALEPGKTVEISLTPWETVEPEFGKFNRVELDDTRALTLPLYWGEITGAAAPEVEAQGASVPETKPSAPEQKPQPSAEITVTVAPTANEQGFIQSQAGAIEHVLSAQGGWAHWFDALRPLHEAIAQNTDPSGAVVAGRGDWLFQQFLTEFLTIPVEPSAYTAWRSARAQHAQGLWVPQWKSAIHAISQTGLALRENGVGLLFVPIPQKLELYPEQLCPGLPEDVPVSPQRYWVMRELLAKNILTVDILPALMARRSDGPSLYPKYDVHWNDRAVRAAAAEIAAAIRRAGWFDALPVEELHLQRQQRRVQNKAPLATALGRELAESEIEWDTVDAVVDEHGAPYDYKLHENAPILVIGDSFMMGSKPGASLAAHLACELQRPVAGHYQENGARELPLLFARKGREFWASRKVIVWFAVDGVLSRHWRDTAFWETQHAAPETPLAGQSANAVSKPQPQVSGPIPQLRVRASLRALSTVPTPEEILPYTENLTVFEYQVDEAIHGTCELPALYVAHWGVRDGKAVNATRRAKPGDTRELTLERFESHPELEGVNVSDDIVSDFSIPVLYDVTGIAQEGERIPMALRAEAQETVRPKAVSSFGPFSDVEIGARAAAIENDLEQIRKMAEARGGWNAWETEQESVRAMLEPLLSPKDKPEFYFGKEGFLWVRPVDIPYCLTETLGLNDPPKKLSDEGARSPVSVITSLNEELKKRNIDLIVIPIPARAEVDPECLVPEGDGLSADWIHPGRMRFVETLLSADVEVLDALPVLRELKKEGKQASLKLESHFTPEAARIIAAATAQRLQRYGFTSDPAYRVELSVSETAGLVHPGVYASRYADALPSLEPEVLPARLVRDLKNKPLTNPESAPILVVGDSYAYVFEKESTDFVSQLSAELNMPIARIVSAGGGPKAPRALAQLEPDVLAKVRVVVWLFSARYLVPAPFILREWKPAALP